jgi:hypothetical protein
MATAIFMARRNAVEGIVSITTAPISAKSTLRTSAAAAPRRHTTCLCCERRRVSGLFYCQDKKPTSADARAAPRPLGTARAGAAFGR